MIVGRGVESRGVQCSINGRELELPLRSVLEGQLELEGKEAGGGGSPAARVRFWVRVFHFFTLTCNDDR